MEELETDDDHAESECASSIQPASPTWQFLFFLFLWQSLFWVSNAALSSLLALLKHFLQVLGTAFQCHPLLDISDRITQIVHGAYSTIGIGGDSFEEYVVCPACDSIYKYKDCVENNVQCRS